MRYYGVALLAIVVAGCSSDPAKRASVAEQEVARLTPPLKPLSEFRNYELKPIAMSAGVMADKAKVQVSQELGAKITARVTPLLDNWRAQKGQTAGGPVLIIEPKVQELRIISGGARFFVGAFMGESFIDLDLKLTDSATGQIIANPRVRQSASAMGGAFSIGATDRNLLDYITDIVHRYLEVHHTLKSTPLVEGR
ncbi:MAG: hypothetical protein ACT4O4_07710 [Nitrospiraceae bacterium]